MYFFKLLVFFCQVCWEVCTYVHACTHACMHFVSFSLLFAASTHANPAGLAVTGCFVTDVWHITYIYTCVSCKHCRTCCCTFVLQSLCIICICSCVCSMHICIAESLHNMHMFMCLFYAHLCCSLCSICICSCVCSTHICVAVFAQYAYVHMSPSMHMPIRAYVYLC